VLPDSPRIWVGSLSDYNSGVLHGEWIDATSDEDDVYQRIAEMLAGSPTTAEHGDPAEEYAIFDHDNFHGLQISEYDSIAEVTRLARLNEEHGEAFAAWTEQVGRNVATSDDAGEKFLHSYVGCYRTKEDYVEGLLDDLGVTAELDEAVNPILRGYVSIDYAMLAQDLELDGSVTFVDGRDGWWWAFVE
jgi:antirestriction protein